MPSKIEWTDETWNPIVGCTKCSPGCLNCYAERMTWRLRNIGIYPYHQHPDLEPVTKRGWTGIITCNDKSLNKPLHWHKPRRIFVCSMSDLFHPKVPFEFIEEVFRVIDKCSRHTFLILTKRPEIAFKYIQYMKQRLSKLQGIEMARWYWPENIHFGVSISNPDEMWKATELSRIPVAVRWISFEPLLADVGKIPLISCREDGNDLEEFGQHIDWVVVGGESGPGARPMHPDWPRNIRDQCVSADVPFCFKQWGKFCPSENGTIAVFNDGSFQRDPTGKFDWLKGYAFERMIPIGKKKAGCLLDGKEWKQLPERR